jgi:surfactin synthase thioesterase subunit
MIDGGHFFIEANRQAVIRRIVEAITNVVARLNVVSSMVDGDGINDI